MSRYDYKSLKPFEDKRIQLVSTEGEVAEAVVYYVYEEEEDLAYNVISTNQPERYAHDKPGMTYMIPFEYIAEVKLIEPEREQP